jgi:hypothetical protein
MIRPREAAPEPLKPADVPGVSQPHGLGILAEVKEFLDGREGQIDPRD